MSIGAMRIDKISRVKVEAMQRVCDAAVAFRLAYAEWWSLHESPKATQNQVHEASAIWHKKQDAAWKAIDDYIKIKGE